MATTSKQVIGLGVWLAISYAAAAIGAIASADAPSFYTQLVRPSWSPPSWLFGPVWTLFYLLIGVAGCLVWKTAGLQGAKVALALYFAQLIANGLWSWLFFRWQNGLLAFVEVAVLWTLIVATILAFWRIKPAAGLLLVPYLLWVTYATALTYAIWQLNPDRLG
jgi:tryptophan-rich sensory protein